MSYGDGYDKLEDENYDPVLQVSGLSAMVKPGIWIVRGDQAKWLQTSIEYLKGTNTGDTHYEPMSPNDNGTVF